MKRIGMFLLFLSIFLLFGVLFVNAQFFEAGVQELKVPVKAPDFTLRVLGGGTMSLKETKGKIILLTFIQDWCSICRRDASSINKLAQTTKDKNVVFLLMAVKWREKELLEFKKEFKISIPILVAEKGTEAEEYKITGYPETFFINRQGKIIGKTFAEKDWTSASMRKLLQHLSATK